MWLSPKEKKIYSLCEGDLLVVEGGDVASSAIIDVPVENLYFQNALFRVRPLANMNIKFLKYWLHFAKDIGYIELICNKATIAHFTKQKFSRLPFFLPPLWEQKEIADFLDWKCGKIENLIEALKKEIELYKELQKSLIAEVVTGKIDVRELI